MWLVGRDGDRRTRTVSAPWTLSLALLGVCNLLTTYWAWQHTVAPIVLQLPYHHCVYELLTDTPAFGVAAVLAIAGNGCLLWSLALHWFRGRAPEAIATAQKSVYWLCGVALVSQLIIVGVNVL